MSDDRNNRIRERAYAIWQAEGEPHGREHDHWTQAEQDTDRDLDAHGAEAGDGEDASRPADADRAA